MKWYYKLMGGHVHVRVFMNGAKCGDLCFRTEEFEDIIAKSLKAGHMRTSCISAFINEDDEIASLRSLNGKL